VLVSDEELARRGAAEQDAKLVTSADKGAVRLEAGRWAPQPRPRKVSRGYARCKAYAARPKLVTQADKGAGARRLSLLSSHAGVRPKGASIPYAASKAALNHMTRLLALSLAPRIRVNAVAPGLVDTPLTADWTAAQQLWRERAPMRRAAQPEDVAQAVALLAASNYMTGEILLLDGGLNLT
jgi:NAD(P)-dependent dehydrogenase (short-subunit alcohol dehydrogenase family)